ncbi:MAG: DUF4270 domain-containing protein [Flavobacteriaceae bacterium]|nr:DUF4270 domain-containing protein [Flavobacteriaceae bacterium]
MKNFLKYLTIIFVIVSIVACETDFENIGATLVDNDNFNTNKATYEVFAYTKDVEKSRVENLGVNSLGIYNPKDQNKNSKYGIFRANVATQLSVPASVDFGLNPTIDAVVLDIPYSATNDGTGENNKPKFILNNIYGNQEIEFLLRVSRLNTFLNTLDPEDPTKPKKYYSNRTYNKLEELFAGNFKPNKNDTVLYVLRAGFEPTIESLDFNYDTIKKSDNAPSIKLPLDHDFFRTNFVENTDTSIFESQELFTQFFNGLLLESEGDDGSVMLLSFVAATLNIYYTNDVLTDETVGENAVDLNGDGDTTDEDVPVKTKQTMTFGFNGVRTNAFERDYSGSVIESALDNIDENKKLYVQGAQGSLISLDAFNTVDLATIRAENWLINEANLVFNIDQDASGKTVPTRLFLYKLDEENNENTQILDILTEGEAIYDGNLQNDGDDGDDTTIEQPLKYRFRITDYLAEILKNEDETPVKFGIKAFHITDLPNLENPADIIVKNFSWNPRGVILYGNDYLETDADYDKRLKLEIFYTKLNE